MRYTLLAIFVGWFFVGTLVGAIGEQIWIGEDEIGVANAILGFKVDQVASGGGLFTMARFSQHFLLTTLPRLSTFDYQFFHGGWEAVRIVMATVFGGPLVFLAAREFFGVVSGLWRR